MSTEATVRGDASPRVTLAAVSLVQLLVSLDLSVVNVALPGIGEDLAAGPVELSWFIHAYALTFGGLLLLGGKAADRYGHRRVLLAGLALFGIASLAGGFALTSGHLIAARAVQGVGAAALQPASLAVLSAAFPPGGPARARAFGVWSAMNALGAALGVLVGGVLTEYVGWRWVMFVNVPVAVVALVLTRTGVAADRQRSARGRIDVAGAVLATAGMTLLVYGVVNTDRQSWASPHTLLCLVAAAGLLAGFVAVEHRATTDPLLRLGLLRNRSVVGANLGNLLIGASITSAFYLMSLYIQDVLGHGPAVTGVMFLPFALGIIAGSLLAASIDQTFSRRALIAGGAAMTAAGFAWFGFISPDGGFAADVLGPSIVASVGFGICLGPIVSTGTVGVASHEVGTASSLLSSARQLGATLGLAALGTVAHVVTGADTSPAAVTAGYAAAMTTAAGLLIAVAVIAWAVLPREGPDPATSRQARDGHHGEAHEQK
ncbi:MFS transporter [Nocardiopsis changdeensis]|uniref:MFS transporter n=1 Tax=Nocardiopsis changdeensis TaxID=2831969 RepID=UPI003F46217E